jgi:DNA-binding Xre family transcriptional regulator
MINSPTYQTSGEVQTMARNIKIRVPGLLRERNITPYRLMKDCKIAPGTAYRLANEEKNDEITGMSFDMLASLCQFFGVGVGEILEFTPDDKQ